MANPIIVHMYKGEITSVKCAGDLQQTIVFVDHVAEEIAKVAPSAVESPDGLVCVEVAHAGYAEPPSADWRIWGETIN